MFYPFEAKLRNKRFPETEIKRLAEREFLVAQRNLDALLADPELVGIDIESEQIGRASCRERVYVLV